MFRLFTTIAVIILVGLRVQAQDIPAPASDSTAVPAAVADTVARTQWYENGLIGKVYRYFKCPHCRQSIRVPRGRGRISITCPKCGTSFIKKS